MNQIQGGFSNFENDFSVQNHSSNQNYDKFNNSSNLNVPTAFDRRNRIHALQTYISHIGTNQDQAIQNHGRQKYPGGVPNQLTNPGEEY